MQTVTRKQKLIADDLDRIVKKVGLDYASILEHPTYMRTALLEGVRRSVVRGEVVSRYTVLDDLLATQISKYLFSVHELAIRKLWRTRKFERFNFFVLEKLSLMEKLAFVKDVYLVPHGVAEKIESINALRNALAHSFFPENLRAYRMKGRVSRQPISVTYKGINIFSIDGIERFSNDCTDVFWSVLTARKRKPKSKRRAPTSLASV